MTKLFLVLLSLNLVFASESVQNFKNGNKVFSADVYKEIAKNEKDDFIVSPFSAQTILALAQNGAKGETATEIRSSLRLPSSRRQINAVFKSLLQKLRKTEGCTFQTANKIYIKDKYPIKPGFNATATEIFHSSTENIDFAQNTIAAEKINNWVSERTNNTIKDLIEPQKLNQDTIAVLINALYFSGAWKKPFKATQTQKRAFKTPTDELEVDMMRKSDFLGYLESGKLDATFLQMPFRGGKDAQMVLVLPNEKGGITDLEAQLEQVYRTRNFTQEYVEVTIPKFKIETSVDFKGVLKSLGVKKAFRKADFSDLAGEKGEIRITDVLQKAFIGVDEDGVVASAATAVIFHPKSLMQGMGSKKTFTADHPFLFYIKINGVVIFTGRVVSPEV
ncbi:antichymotrypsin-2 [Tribolium castaneum]|uniref:Serpin peptidase inhibitor 24 n=1 Tax=Tribolium castaneum TaxID=7070 RepID=D6WVP4_TRICA|nr:PREDICTED: antichymotrypsin-2 [Tribolium castaneum]EFA09222.1 serpin peptidase inhibitor 24 [Tribolium castaneum]|eukprot:XP_974001.1 PREDICTED: antichymotrypsin-2 [Tribolium castaneum]